MPARIACLEFDHVWQFALAIKQCPQQLAVPMAEANPKIAAQFAQQEAMYESLNAPNPLHAAVAAAHDDTARLMLIAAAPDDERAEYANDLALLEYSQEQVCGNYRQLILGEA